MGLEGLVSEHLDSLKREAAIASGSASSVIALFGWGLQQGYLKDSLPNYDFLVGHVGDFGLSGTLTSLGILLTSGRSRLEQFIGAAAFPTILTIKEYVPFFTQEPDNYDPLTHYLAAGIVFGYAKLSNAENRARIGQSIGNFSVRVSKGIALAYKNYVGGIFTK